MNVNIVKAPAKDSADIAVQAVNNEVVFIFDSDTISSFGVKAALYFQITTINDDEKIIINGVEFTAKDSPGLGQFPSTATVSAIEVAEDLAHLINQNPALNPDYFAIPYINYVFFEARFEGTKYNITYTVPAGVTIAQNTAGVDRYRAQTLDDYGVYVEIYEGNLGNFGAIPNPYIQNSSPLTSIEKDFGGNNSFQFDLAGALKMLVESESPEIQTGFFKQDQPLTQYRLIFGERWTKSTGQVKYSQIGEIENLWAYNGSLIPGTENDMVVFYDSDYAIPPLQPRPFLTNRNNCQVQFDELAWGFFMVPDPNYPRYEITFIAEFYDGTTYPLYIGALSRFYSGVASVRIDPNGIGVLFVESFSGKMVRSYTIWVRDQATLLNIAGPMVLNINRKCSTRVFGWYNEHGVMDSFGFTGEETTDTDLDITKFTRTTDLNNLTREISQRGILQSNPTEIFSTTTGLLDGATYNWLRGSLRSTNQIYLVDGTVGSESIIAVELQDIDDKSSNNDLLRTITIKWSQIHNSVQG